LAEQRQAGAIDHLGALGWVRERAAPRDDPEPAGLQLERDAARGKSMGAKALRELAGEGLQFLGERLRGCGGAVEGGVDRGALGRSVRYHGAFVLAAREAIEPMADRAVAGDQLALAALTELADRGDAVARETLRQRRAHAPEHAHRLRCQEGERLAAADHREA